MKRLSWFLFAFLLGGCAAFHTTTPTATPPFSPPPTPTLTPAVAVEDGYVELDLWISDAILPPDATEEESPLLAQLSAFSERHERVEINVQVKRNEGEGGLLNLLETASKVAPSVLPDLVLMDEATMREAASESLLRPLLSGEMPASTYPTAIQAGRVGTGTYGLPYLVGVEGMALRAGRELTLTEGRLTWGTVLSESLTFLFPAAPSDGLADDFLLRLYLSTGGRLQDESGNPALDRAALEETYRFLFTALGQGLISPEVLAEMDDARTCWDHFREDGRWQLTVLPAADYWLASPREGRPVAALVPMTQTDVPQIGHYWLWTLVTDDPARRQASVELLAWLLYPPNLSESSQAAGLFPTTGEALALWPLPPDDFTFVSRMVVAASPSAPQPIEGNVRKALQSGLMLLLQDPLNITPDEAAEQALLTLRK